MIPGVIAVIVKDTTVLRTVFYHFLRNVILVNSNTQALNRLNMYMYMTPLNDFKLDISLE